MNEIRSIIKILGDADKVREVIMNLKSELSKVDFNKVIPIKNDQDDLPMDDKICACLNVFIEHHSAENIDTYVKTLSFVGHTREIPYDFKVMKSEELNKFKQRYGVKKMLNVANKYLEKVTNKLIFNGYLQRCALWGSGCGATNIEIKENVIKFSTYYNPPIEIVKKLASMYPELRFEYRIKTDEKERYMILNGNNIDIKIENEIGDTFAFNLIRQNVLIK